MTKQESPSQATNGSLGDAAHRVALGTLALTRAGVRHTATLVDGIVGGGLQAAGGAMDAAGDAARMVVRTLGSRAGDAVELRVTRILNAFQIPTSRDVKELARRVERLSQMVAAQSASKSSADAESPTRRSSTTKPRRRTAKKKAAKRKTTTRSKTNGSARRRRAKKTS